MNPLPWIPPWRIILASRSPRRIELLSALGFPFTVRHAGIDETYPEHLSMTGIPLYLARRKAEPFIDALAADELLITADTIVWLNGQVLGKPEGEEKAREMLRKLSGKVHQVVTGVCLTTRSKEKCFHAVSHVEFKILTGEEIDRFSPLPSRRRLESRPHHRVQSGEVT